MQRALVFLTLVAALLTASLAQTTAGNKVIKDPEEYNAYITALNTKDPAAKAGAMEAFVKQYPQSVMLQDALEQAMAGYQQSGNVAQVMATAKRVLTIAPNNVRALAIVTAVGRGSVNSPDSEACASARSGLAQLPSWTRPEGVNDKDFETMRSQMTAIFSGTAGFCALQAKDYDAAKGYYAKSVESDPTNLQDVYQLSIAELEKKPLEVDGLWHCTKAMTLAQAQGNAAGAQSIGKYCKARYKKYHGGEDGWDQLVTQTTSETTLPAGFSARIKPAMTPCEFAVQAVKENDPSSLSFGDKEFILSKVNCSAANKEAADKTWQSIQDLEKGGTVMLKVPVKVISATSTSIEGAVSQESQDANTADIHIELAKASGQPPEKGSTVDVTGVITAYTPEPFLFTMQKAELPDAKPPVKKPPTKPAVRKAQ